MQAAADQQPGALRRARARARRRAGAARASSWCRRRGRTATSARIVELADRGVAARRGRRVRRLADPRERLDGARSAASACRVAARHVCLLFRRFKHFRDDATRPYARALEARRIPHVLVGGRSFHDREEVIALRNALTAIEWPDDELSVYATLRGPLFALTDDVLLAWRAARRHDPSARAACEARRASSRSCARSPRRSTCSRDLHRGRNRRPIADTVGQLLEAVRAHAALAIWPTGEQALANCLRVMDLARRFERQGAASFRAFVDRLEEDAEGGETEDAPVVEEGTEGVRIMTAHRAKGLEFPVVVLVRSDREGDARAAEPPRRPRALALGRAARGLRAARAARGARGRAARAIAPRRCGSPTSPRRARAICSWCTAVADEELEDTWLSALHPAIYPTPRSPGEGEPAPGCPAFRGAAVARAAQERAARQARARERGPAHAARGPTLGGVVGPEGARARRAGARRPAPAAHPRGRRERQRADEGERLHAQWQSEREALLAAGARASCAVVPVTALARRARRGGAVPEVRIETVAARARAARRAPLRRARARGARRGRSARGAPEVRARRRRSRGGSSARARRRSRRRAPRWSRRSRIP